MARLHVACAGVLFLLGCASEHSALNSDEPSATPVHIRVLAAASLADSLTEIRDAFQRGAHADVELAFDATSRLARQIENGVDADVFVSADQEWMDELVEHQLVDRSRIEVLAGNHLVVVAPRNATPSLSAPEQLAGDAVQHLALAESSVPAGRYAESSLSALGLLNTLAPRIVRAPNVRATLAHVAAGNAEAGIVYATDARVDNRVRVEFQLADSLHAPIEYRIAPLRGSAHPEEAQAFVAAAMSPEAQRSLSAHGFVLPQGRAHAH